MTDKLRTEGRLPSDFGANQVPPTPIDDTDPAYAPEMPARPGTTMEQPPVYSDAPPSYEDAMASNLPSVTAPRPEYNPPPAEADPVLHADEKKGWH
jgi:hypothetical protein